ncbi:MAG TPA: hypothetical protein VGK02_05230 [Candidatus Aquicultor sp.]|jgi:hypothetical protein
MDINHIGIALASYLTGAVALYAYLNRNRYIDIAIASVAVFVFGTGMLMTGVNILARYSSVLVAASTGIMGIAAVILLVRLARDAVDALFERPGPRSTQRPRLSRRLPPRRQQNEQSRSSEPGSSDAPDAPDNNRHASGT